MSHPIDDWSHRQKHRRSKRHLHSISSTEELLHKTSHTCAAVNLARTESDPVIHIANSGSNRCLFTLTYMHSCLIAWQSF